MVEYNQNIILEFADRLYNKANTIIATYAIGCAIIGLFLGYKSSYGGKAIEAAIIGGAILGTIGYYLGTEKAFSLKLQAQTALCQAKIEENTRKQKYKGKGKEYENIEDTQVEQAEEESLEFCYHCGMKLSKKAQNCPECGKRL